MIVQLLPECSDAVKLLELQIDFQHELIEHEELSIAFADVYRQFEATIPAEFDFADQITTNAKQRIAQLKTELRVLQLKLKEAKRHEPN